LLSTRAHSYARIYADAGTDSDAHTGLRFLSAANHIVSRWPDKNTRNVALLLPVRLQSLRDTVTKSEPILWQAP